MPDKHRIYFQLVVALGNPGEKYDFTRHNAGFIIADQFIMSYAKGNIETFEKYDSKITKIVIKGKNVFILKPMTFMNLSGNAVRKFIDSEKIKLEETIVIHDDMDLELGKFKFSFGAGAGGHNGVQSIIDAMNDNKNFARLRIGIGKNKNLTGAEYVLSKFDEHEWRIFKNTVELSVSALNFALLNGISSAMNFYHKKTTKIE